MQKTGERIILSATDLANHLACRHLTELNRKLALGELKKPFRDDPILETIIERGNEHEAAYVGHLRKSGSTLIEIEQWDAEAQLKTLAAMKEGADVIVQGALGNEVWTGRPDLLVKVNVPSKFGDWSYEVADTKLTRNTKAGTILQLCLYSELLATSQDTVPRQMAVIKPGDPFEIEAYRVDDFMAYFRLAKSRLEQTIGNPPSKLSYPDPVPHCDICNWWKHCNAQRRNDDHLSFVAGIQNLQIGELHRQNVTTIEKLATSDQPLESPPEKGSLKSYDRIQKQARIQHQGRSQKQTVYEFLDVEEARGFLRLPEPDSSDIFFDIEGDPHVRGGGLEYLLGYVQSEGGIADATFTGIWSLDRHSEKVAFEQFIDYVMDQWQLNPGMHVYHYASYEQSAVKRLAMRHATREDEVDHLLRAERFVDLYAVVRQGIRASVESYSIKKLEAFYGYDRLEELADARHSLHRLERAIELGRCREVSEPDMAVVERYNKDDCLSTLALRDWLESLRAELISNGAQLPRPELKDGLASETAEDQKGRTAELYRKLVDGLPADNRTDEHDARWLLAHLLDYFRREAKCTWWEYFRLRELDNEELLKERNAIGGLEFQEKLPKRPKARNETHRYVFPPQEVTLEAGDQLYADDGEPIGSVAAIDLSEGALDIRKRADSGDHHPSAVFGHEYVNPDPMPESLMLLAETVIGTGERDSTPRTARYDLLARRPPRLRTKSLPLEVSAQEAAMQLVFDLDQGVLPIQGPPGTGKTHVGSEMIRALAAKGHRVGVTAVSHKVIANLLYRVYDGPVRTQVAHRSDDKQDMARGCKRLKRKREILQALNEGRVVGGTAWAWSCTEAEGQLDYLFIDEAGQMSLAMALAAGRAAKNIVLLGDPQQLEQPQKGTHPEGADIAALKHLIGEHDTIPADRGLFLDETWRLHPKICEFTSSQYYDCRLKSRDWLDQQLINGNSPIAGRQLVFEPVDHSGNQNRSPEEAERIKQILNELTQGGNRCTDGDDKNEMQLDDIVVVAPYNAQVADLRRKLPEGARVGTVDKFQGQEAPIVIYSMTSSSVEDAPRGTDFLFSPNRFNVATSRAKCLVIVVGSSNLLECDCKSVEQMRRINGLCRFIDFAHGQG